jgi:hypothetical protein
MRVQARGRWFLVVILLAMVCPIAFSQQAAGSPSGRPAAAPASVSPTQLIQFLNQTINWYHQVIIQQEIATEPEEQLTLYDNRQIANQVVRLAFDFARAQAETIAELPSSKQAAESGTSLPQYETLRRMQAKLDQQYQDTQQELDSDKKKLATASGAARRKLEPEISELQAELALTDAHRDAVRSIAQFVTSSATSNMARPA